MRRKVKNKLFCNRILAAVMAGGILSSCCAAPVWAAGTTGGSSFTMGASEFYGVLSVEGSDVIGSNVIFDDSNSGINICGGYGDGSALVAENTVTITGNSVIFEVYGGYSDRSDTGTVKNNHVIIESGAVIDGYVEGGAVTGSGIVEGNIVIVDGADVMGGVKGGNGSSEGGDIVRNRVTLRNAHVVENVTGGSSYGKGMAAYNEVIISGNSKLDFFVIGGSCSGTGEVSQNTVTMSGGNVKYDINGGYSSQNATVTGNHVIISGGSIGRYVLGGYSIKGDATGNTVLISGGEFKGNIFGGRVDSAGNATGNTVTITRDSGANPIIGGAIYGGYGNNAVDNYTGNTFNIYTKGLEAKDIKNFENLNFYLPEDTVNGDTVLTLTNAGGTDISGSKVSVGLSGSSSVLQAGDKVNLLTNSNGIKADDVIYGRLQQGVSIEYEFTTELSGNSVVATLNGEDEKPAGKTTEQSKSPVETQAAAAAFVNSGADTVAGSGMASAVQLAGNGSAEMFGTMGGGSMKYKSGSYTDMRGYNLALGFAKSVANNAGKLTCGPLLEYGWGNYTSHLDSGIRADGNTKYYGIGALIRQDNNSGMYYEGSVRYGRMDADYASSNMIGAGGEKVYASYDSSSSYYGAHLGIGKINKLNDSVKADLYAKLFYTRQSGDSVILGGAGNGEEYTFDAVDSIRARFGARLSKDCGSGSGYAGLAYEYEFDGEARATVKGLSTPSPSIKGSSGMLELGYILRPGGSNGTAVDIGLQNWLGKKQGISASVNVLFKF